MITGHLEAAEALIRWRTPDGRQILPGEFIPIAQDSGILPSITSHMFPRLLADILVLNSAQENLRAAFNTCADDFHRQQLTNQVLTAIETQQLCPTSIQIEITESSVLSGNNSVKGRIQSMVDAATRELIVMTGWMQRISNCTRPLVYWIWGGVRGEDDKYKLTTMPRKLGDKSIEVVSFLQQLEETALTNPRYGYLKKAG